MSLPIIRSLGKAGKNIICTEPDDTPKKAAIGAYSKYASAFERTPSPTDESAFVDRLSEIASGEFPVLMPVGIESLLTICRHQDKVREFAKIAVPSYEMIKLANDKNELLSHAEKIGIPCPNTTSLTDGESIEDLAERVVFPAVIKYREGELLHISAEERYVIVRDKPSFIEKYTAMHEKQESPIVQEYVEGEGFGVSAVFDTNHNPIKVFCHRRLREYPISGGPSSLCESFWDSTLVKYATDLLRSLDWVGVAMVEFKGKDDSYKLMEINPRFWGSVALAPLSGCDISGALYDAAIGKTAEISSEPKCDYKLGVKMRFFFQDILAVLAGLKNKRPVTSGDTLFVDEGKKNNSLEPSFVKRVDTKAFGRMDLQTGVFKNLKAFFSLFNLRIKGGVFSISDLAPCFRYLVNVIRKAGNNAH